MRLTWMRGLFALLFLALFTYVAAGRTQAYYAAFEMPPSFRHMDASSLRQVLVDYLEAQQVGPDTLLVLGDCVAFGHGVKRSFSSYLKAPGLRVVNVSMQSFRYDLMLATIVEAQRRGVNNVLIQLHPFEDYAFEARMWEALSLPAVDVGSAVDFVQQAEANWRRLSAATEQGSDNSYYLARSDTPWTAFSTLLRNDVLARWSLYRDRFAIDDWSQSRLSYYAERTHRIDSYARILPVERQIQILESQSDFWPAFVISDREAYRSRVLKHSAPARLASTMRDLGMNAVFVWAPTFVDFLTEHTVLERQDLVTAASTMEGIVASFGYGFINLLEDPILDAQMMHYDNLTVQGQETMGNTLNVLLAGAF